jgi:hypothetical protein
VYKRQYLLQSVTVPAAWAAGAAMAATTTISAIATMMSRAVLAGVDENGRVVMAVFLRR